MAAPPTTTRSVLIPRSVGWLGTLGVLAVAAALLSGRLSHSQGDHLLYALGALLVIMWLYSRHALDRRTAWVRAAMQRAGDGELGVRLEVPDDAAWAGIAASFNATMGNLERDRRLLLLRETELSQRNAALLSLREALDSHAIVSVTSLTGDIVFVNDKFCRVSGYEAHELLGRNHRILKSGAHDAAFYQHLWSTIRAGRAWHGVFRNRRKDGEDYWVQSSILPVLDADGHPRQFISIRTDISSRERLRIGLEMLATAEEGHDLFARIARALAVGLDARWAGLARLHDDISSLEVLACWDAGQDGAPFSYKLQGTPCEQALMQTTPFVVERDVRTRFPAALALATREVNSYRGLAIADQRGVPTGVLWAISERDTEADSGEAALLAVAAKRVAAELARLGVESELREQENRLTLVVDSAALGIWDWDMRTGCIKSNARLARMIGYEPEELATQARWVALAHPDDVPQLRAAARAHLAGRAAFFVTELRVRHANGDWVWILSRGRIAERDTDGRPLRMVGIHLDINERKRAEAGLIASEARFRTLVENVAVGIYLCDLQGQVVYANPPAERLFNLRVGEVADTGWYRRIHPDDAPGVIIRWEALRNGLAQHFEADFRLERDVHDVRHVHSLAHAVNVDGRLTGYVGAVEDVTERHADAQERDRLQGQLQQAQKMEALGQLTGGIAHDFNNILASILGYASLAHSRYAGDNAKLAEYLAAVIAAGERARDLIGKMLAFSRHAPREDGTSMDVATMVREVTTLLASVIPSSIEIAVDVAPNLPRVQLGATDLHQMLVNLAVNARDAMGESGCLHIGVSAVQCEREVCATCHDLIGGQFVEILCRDTGKGIDEEVLTRIFEPFFTTKDVGKGTGMGLAVVHGIVHRAGGHLLVESAPEAGTAFRILLPPASGNERVKDATSASVPAPPSTDPGRVLVADDEPMIAAYVRELLESQGHQVTLAHDGAAALALFRERPDAFDLVITDQTMPRLSGTGLVKAIRALRPGVPAVLCTGYSDSIDLRSARKLGVSRFLTKPVESQTMLRVVSELLADVPPAQLTPGSLPSR